MLVLGPVVGLVVRDAEADDRRLGEVLPVGLGMHEVLEELAVQVAKVVGDAERGPVLVVPLQQHAEVVVPHVGRQVVPDDALGALAGLLVEDVGLQHLDRRHGVTGAISANPHLDGNNLELDGVAVGAGVVPAGQGVEAVVDHLQRLAQVLLAFGPAGQIGEVGGDARAVRRLVMLIEANALDREGKRWVQGGHGVRASEGLSMAAS